MDCQRENSQGHDLGYMLATQVGADQPVAGLENVTLPTGFLLKTV